jgi:hypothetical protein
MKLSDVVKELLLNEGMIRVSWQAGATEPDAPHHL